MAYAKNSASTVHLNRYLSPCLTYLNILAFLLTGQLRAQYLVTWLNHNSYHKYLP